MAEPLLLAYVFATFVVGAACIGAVLVLARLRHDELARAFLWFYVPLSVLVLAALLLSLAQLQVGATAGTVRAFEYLEGFVGRYGVMLALPLFARGVFGVRGRRGDGVVAEIVLFTLTAQHVTEFGLAGTVWDARGDLVEDLVLAGIVGYTLLLAARRIDDAAYPPLARRFRTLLVLGVPVVIFDVFVADGVGPRLYPLWYCVIGVTLVVTLARRRVTASGAAPREWELTEREVEVLRLVQQGLSTRAIGRRLTISPNTVKTHLRSIFDKSGFRNRVALIAQSGSHPIG